MSADKTPRIPRQRDNGHAVTTSRGGQTRVQSTRGNAEVERNRNGYAVHTNPPQGNK